MIFFVLTHWGPAQGGGALCHHRPICFGILKQEICFARIPSVEDLHSIGGRRPANHTKEVLSGGKLLPTSKPNKILLGSNRFACQRRHDDGDSAFPLVDKSCDGNSCSQQLHWPLAATGLGL